MHYGAGIPYLRVDTSLLSVEQCCGDHGETRRMTAWGRKRKIGRFRKCSRWGQARLRAAIFAPAIEYSGKPDLVFAVSQRGRQVGYIEPL